MGTAMNPVPVGAPSALRPATVAIPLALYIHVPWCVKKCPYCDFNSHGLTGRDPPYDDYVAALLADLDGDLADFGDALRGREIVSVFFGGGTPSLMPPGSVAAILDGAARRLAFVRECEITLETNPGTVEHGRFDGYRAAGVNRISFGVQSFDDDALRALGRIHSSAEAETAVMSAQDAGYANINLDLMYALPRQTAGGALADVERAIALGPSHISHYQLTLEPGTPFAKHPPPLPNDDDAWVIQESCEARLADAGFAQYEVSAYARSGRRCVHNMNYWRFGDYLGIGAGAHGKITCYDEPDAGTARGDTIRIHRRSKVKAPRAYLDRARSQARIDTDGPVPGNERAFEYVLNALRLNDGAPIEEFTARTGLALDDIRAPLATAMDRGLVSSDGRTLGTTETGRRFLNDVLELFLPRS